MTRSPSSVGKADRTRAAILAAARELFAAHGFERATLRDIAARAGVDPALAVRYFGGKDALFARAAAFDLRLPDLRAVPPASIGETMVRHFLGLWECADGDNGLAVLLRSAASNEAAAERLREVFAGQVLPAIAAGGATDAERRAGLAASQLLGLALCRYILKLPPVAAMSPDDIVAHVGPTLQRYVAGPP